MPLMPDGNFVPQQVLQTGTAPTPQMGNMQPPPQAQLNAQGTAGPGVGGAATAEGVAAAMPADMSPAAPAPQQAAPPPQQPAPAAPGPTPPQQLQTPAMPSPNGWQPNPAGEVVYSPGEGPVSAQVGPVTGEVGAPTENPGQLALEKLSRQAFERGEMRKAAHSRAVRGLLASGQLKVAGELQAEATKYSNMRNTGVLGEMGKESDRALAHKAAMDALAQINLQRAAQRAATEEEEETDEPTPQIPKMAKSLNTESKGVIQRLAPSYSETKKSEKLFPARWGKGHQFQGSKQKQADLKTNSQVIFGQEDHVNGKMRTLRQKESRTAAKSLGRAAAEKRSSAQKTRAATQGQAKMKAASTVPAGNVLGGMTASGLQNQGSLSNTLKSLLKNQAVSGGLIGAGIGGAGGLAASLTLPDNRDEKDRENWRLPLYGALTGGSAGTIAGLFNQGGLKTPTNFPAPPVPTVEMANKQGSEKRAEEPFVTQNPLASLAMVGGGGLLGAAGGVGVDRGIAGANWLFGGQKASPEERKARLQAALFSGTGVGMGLVGSKLLRDYIQSKTAMNRSAVGESGLKAKEKPWSLQGSDAWPSANEMWSAAKKWDSGLPPSSKKPMKLALSTTAQAFLDRCVEKGLNEFQIAHAVKTASAVNPKVAEDLAPILEKQANPLIGGALRLGGKALGWGRKAFGMGKNVAGMPSKAIDKAWSPVANFAAKSNSPMVQNAGKAVADIGSTASKGGLLGYGLDVAQNSVDSNKPLFAPGANTAAFASGGAAGRAAYGGLTALGAAKNTVAPALSGAAGVAATPYFMNTGAQMVNRLTTPTDQMAQQYVAGLQDKPEQLGKLVSQGMGMVANATPEQLQKMGPEAQALNALQRGDIAPAINLMSQNPEAAKNMAAQLKDPNQLAALVQALPPEVRDANPMLKALASGNSSAGFSAMIGQNPELQQSFMRAGFMDEKGQLDPQFEEKLPGMLDQFTKFKEFQNTLPGKLAMGFMELEPWQQAGLAGGVAVTLLGAGAALGGSGGMGTLLGGGGLLMAAASMFGPQLMDWIQSLTAGKQGGGAGAAAPGYIDDFSQGSTAVDPNGMPIDQMGQQMPLLQSLPQAPPQMSPQVGMVPQQGLPSFFDINPNMS